MDTIPLFLRNPLERVRTPAIMTRPHVGTRSLCPKKIRLRPRTAVAYLERRRRENQISLWSQVSHRSVISNCEPVLYLLHGMWVLEAVRSGLHRTFHIKVTSPLFLLNIRLWWRWLVLSQFYFLKIQNLHRYLECSLHSCIFLNNFLW